MQMNLTKRRIAVASGWAGRVELKEASGSVLEMLDLFIILTGMMVSQVYMYVKPHPPIFDVQFIVHHLYLSKAIK